MDGQACYTQAQRTDLCKDMLKDKLSADSLILFNKKILLLPISSPHPSPS